MDESLQYLLLRGRAAAKAGDVSEARFYLEWALRQTTSVSQDRLEALYWLSQITQDTQEKREYLTDILAVEPSNSRARYQLSILDGKITPDKSFDPDQVRMADRPDTVSVEDTDVQRFTCPNCGGRMTFTPDGISLSCEYCESRAALINENQKDGQPNEVGEEAFLAGLSSASGHIHPVSTQIVACQGCGATFLEPPVNLTMTCPYCEAVYVARPEEIHEIIPASGLIPFQISAREALRNIQRWLSEQRIYPEDTVPLPQGLYLPVWAFNFSGQIEWKGWYEQQNWLTDKKPPIRIPREGSNPIIDRNILVPGSSRLKELFIAQLKSFDLERMVPYDPRYLVNWLAETYQVSLAQASLQAREIVYRNAQSATSSLYCQGLEDVRFKSTGIFIETYRLILLPVWVGHYLEDGIRVELLVNGQTGDVQGNNPSRGIQSWFERIFGED